jgi:hypothetical protein
MVLYSIIVKIYYILLSIFVVCPPEFMSIMYYLIVLWNYNKDTEIQAFFLI